MNYKILSNVKFVFLLFFIISCSNRSHKTNPAKTLTEIMKADNAGDVEKIIAFYTSDAMLMPAGKINISGRDSIRQNYTNIFSTSKLQLDATIDEVIESGSMAMIRGNTIGKVIRLNDNSATNVSDKFLMILKKETGVWKIYRLMWSKNEDH